ncbi:hypothetical protein [Kocuria sp.]|uniref:hypothetical protein n=1 Tax=Kocuria sp. TaxID=1871328 RepID=UPI0026DC4EAD|nr:hypothetical protein [Kocuria sp.]MDO4918952.1 hypothetical protein [Kocuria sp.]
MTRPAEPREAPMGTAADIPGPGRAVARAFPACALGLFAPPVVAHFLPREPSDGWWPTLIVILVLLAMFGVVLLDRRRLPRQPRDVDDLRWQGALSSARHHRGVPEHPGVRLMAARVAYDRVWMFMLFWALLVGYAGAALTRPDLDWLPGVGGMLVFSVMALVRLPAAWAYLRENDAAHPPPPA